MAPSDSGSGLQLQIGDVISHYRITDILGAGGMGVVYRAVDTRLDRAVALKIIRRDPLEGDRRQRFIKEARAASAFNHPNIVTIHEVDAAADTDFIVMELLSGRSLDKQIPAAGLPIDEAIGLAEQVAAALDAAHTAGIVHRDIKPANVMVTDTGHVKVLDFGIAKQLLQTAPDADTLTAIDATRPGTVLGSVSYMSPEQTQGRAVDGRSDVFSFGVLLYEMLSGRRPFGGTTEIETVAKILEAQPQPLATLRSDVPPALAAMVSACLEKNRDRRPTAREVHRQLVALRESRTAATARAGGVLRRPAVVGSFVAVLVAIAVIAWWQWNSGREVRDARRRLPMILALAEQVDSQGFYREARSVVPALPDEFRLQQLWNDLTIGPVSVRSSPDGAEVLVKSYSAADDQWISLGRTPIAGARLPGGVPRLKVLKDGYAPFDGTINEGVARGDSSGLILDFRLEPVASVPSGMIRMPAGRASIEGVESTIADFWMDEFEVSNRRFKAFVDAGGYKRREYWKEPFVENGRTVSWEDAMTRFHDQTGRAGPATWELGAFPQGQAEYPVGGVSWYEAAAFAAFAGEALPTAFQWRFAAGFQGPAGVFGDILIYSNFGQKGPAPVGANRGIGPYGQHDMAGNVKEWCWNETRGGRTLYGGGWNEPVYMYEDKDAQLPFTRLATYGFRLVKNIDAQPAGSVAYLPPAARDYSVEKPIDEAAFAVARSIYQYDPRPLNDRVERTEETPDWRRETITLDAAYGHERVIAYLYLPKSAAPPYQPVVYFPGGDAPMIRSSRVLNLINIDFLIRSGRALVFPVYQGTYERGSYPPIRNSGRDVTVDRVKDFRRIVEYIGSRRDLDRNRIGYYGVSLGAFTGILINAVEPQVKAAVFLGGGLSRGATPPEVDPLNFAPRIRVPTLMVNGRSDFQFPYEAVQLPLFRLLDLPPDQKRHALFEGGHMPSNIHDVMREILDWFDRFLGTPTPA